MNASPPSKSSMYYETRKSPSSTSTSTASITMIDDNSSIASSTTASTRRTIFPTVKRQYSDAPYSQGSTARPARLSRSIAPAAQSCASSIASEMSGLGGSISGTCPIDVIWEVQNHVRTGVAPGKVRVVPKSKSTPPIVPVQQIPTQIPSKSKPKKMSMEKQLCHQLRSKNINNPSIQEFNECKAFFNAGRSYFGKNTQFDVVIDVSGHGTLGALFLILTSAKRAVIIDPAEEEVAVVGQNEKENGVDKAWGDFYKQKELIYHHESCPMTGLQNELDIILNQMNVSPLRVLVVACHACPRLSDETLEIACSYGVHAAVMPCYQKDLTGGSWKAVGKNLGVDIDSLMDVLMARKASSWNTGVTYQVRMKTIDKKITTQNRIILCRAIACAETSNQAKVAAREKSERAYKKAESRSRGVLSKKGKYFGIARKHSFCVQSAAMGLVAGLVVANLSRRRG